MQSIWLIAKYFIKRKFLNKGVGLLLFVFATTQLLVIIDGWNAYEKQLHSKKHYQSEDRKSWEENPDKHPHRMSHFGSFAFRLQHPLSVFDSGLENYTGNVIYLEAHKQNTANFSEASFSTGLMRFGDLNATMLIYLILPLFLFFIGYDAVSGERENQTLKLISIQGVSRKNILLGKGTGLFLGITLFLLPSMIALSVIGILSEVREEIVLRIVFIIFTFLIFFIILSFFTILVSAKSKSSNQSLLFLLGFWLLFFVVMPKFSQSLGSYLHPNPSKLSFQKAIENDVAKIGNSHNPNDPYFNSIRDSILKVYNVNDVTKLPFNYGGYIMGRGEAQTSSIYNKHQEKLVRKYRKQNQLSNYLSLINPYIAIKQLSMSLCGSDFETYEEFLRQAESYRYSLAQKMNKLQMDYISSNAPRKTEGKINVVDKKHWKEFPAFRFKYTKILEILKKQMFAFASLALWCAFLLISIFKFHRKYSLL